MGFLDVETAAGGSSDFCSIPATDAITFLALNLLNNGFAKSVLLPALTNVFPNPTSELPWAPATNIREGPRHRAWITEGCFAFGDSTLSPGRGIEMTTATGGNYNFRVTDSGGTANVDIRSTTPTTFIKSGGYGVAAQLQSKLNADTTLAGTYTVTFSGRKDSSPTFKFTISCAETFSLVALRATDVNSGFPSIGFTTDRSAASSYVGDEIAIHTEEALVIDMGPTGWQINNATLTDKWSWIYLVDCNFSGPDETDSYGGNKLNLYLGSTLSAVDNKADANFNLHRTMFRLGRTTVLSPATLASLGNWEGTDTGLYVMRSGGAAAGAFPSRLYAANIQRWRAANNTGANAEAPNHRYVRLKIVDRKNPQGQVKVGKIYIGPGFSFLRNWIWRSLFSPVDRSERSQGVDGGENRRFREPGRLAEGTWGDRNPLTEVEAMLLDSLVLRSRRVERDSSGNLIATPGLDSVLSNPRVITGRSAPMAVMDPNFRPTLADSSFKYAGQMLYGTGTFSDLAPLMTNGWQGRFRLDSEVL